MTFNLRKVLAVLTIPFLLFLIGEYKAYQADQHLKDVVASIQKDGFTRIYLGTK